MIKRHDAEDIDPWNSLTFGIETNKPAECKLDTNHTMNFEEMSYSFTQENDIKTQHQITISPFVVSSLTLTLFFVSVI